MSYLSLTQRFGGGPPPVAPNPCLPNVTNEPQFHVYNMAIGPHDPNAIFKYRGVWHAFHQANWTDWAHLTSDDLVRWTRQPSALFPNGDWDGSLTMLDGEPLILFDCYNVPDCKPLNASGVGKPPASPPVGAPLDPPIVGVARPANTSDPLLIDWVKDSRNPISITSAAGTPVTRGFAGPSNVWRAGGAVQMLMQLGGAIGRFESTDPLLHNWSIADPAFFPTGGRGGSGSESVAFFPLRPKPPLGGPTHLLGGLWPAGTARYSVGTAWYYLVAFDEESRTLVNASAARAQPLDSSALVNWPITHEADDGSGRLLHLGWFNVQPTQGCLTVPRSVTYDAQTSKLLSLPVAEVALLRAGALGRTTAAAALAPAASLGLFASGKRSTTFDLEAELELPKAADGGTSRLRLSLLASAPSVAAVFIDINASAPFVASSSSSLSPPPRRSSPPSSSASSAAAAGGSFRNVTMSAAVPHATNAAFNTSGITFLLPASEPLAIRALADRVLVEVFVGGGRGVVSSPVLAPGSDPTLAAAFVTNLGDAPLTLASSAAWAMGCGWARYP